MTDNEIIKALECCIKECDYEHCPYYVNDRYECGDNFNKDILNLINRQKAEKETMQSYIDCLKAEIENMNNLVVYNATCATKLQLKLVEAKAEAVKEFAKFLKDRSEGGVISVADLPELVIVWERKVESGD